MKKSNSDAENEVFAYLTSGMIPNLIMVPVEINGKDTNCIFTYEQAEGTEFLVFTPIAILCNEDIAPMMKVPEQLGKITISDLNREDEEDEDNDDPLFGLDRLN